MNEMGGIKKEERHSLSEIAMTEKPNISQLKRAMRVGRDYFRHATPLTGLVWSGLVWALGAVKTWACTEYQSISPALPPLYRLIPTNPGDLTANIYRNELT